MKKVYINPAITIAKVESTKLLADSMKYGGQTSQTSGNLTKDRDEDHESNTWSDGGLW